MKTTWWEFNGVETKLPNGLVMRKSGGFDLRYRVNKAFFADKRWGFHDPMGDYYAGKVLDNILKPNIILESINQTKKKG